MGNSPACYPGFTIESTRNTTTTATFVNNLPMSPLLQRYLIVDQTVHWADPLGEMGSFTPYSGPPPVVAHLHGGATPSAYDGNPDSWFTPGPADQRLTGNGFVTNVYEYPNVQEATMLWLHDHCLGATRLTVYGGLVALYLLRDQYDTGQPGMGLNLPAGAYEIEMAIQDRQFDTNGQWLFPWSAPGGLQGPPPDPAVHPFWIPMFLGDVMVVNGKSWPYLEVEPRRYRFRVLNGCNSRFLELKLVNPATQPFWQIGSDGGLLDAPVKLNDPASASPLSLLLAPPSAPISSSTSPPTPARPCASLTAPMRLTLRAPRRIWPRPPRSWNSASARRSAAAATPAMTLPWERACAGEPTSPR